MKYNIADCLVRIKIKCFSYNNVTGKPLDFIPSKRLIHCTNKSFLLWYELSKNKIELNIFLYNKSTITEMQAKITWITTNV